MRSRQNIEAALGHPFTKELRIRVQFIAQIRRGAHQLKHLEGRAHDGRRYGIRKQVWTRTLAQQVDNLAPAARVTSTRTAQSFTQGSGEDIDAAHDAVVFM